MIIINLHGGLGNQLFQIAFGYSLLKKYNVNVHYYRNDKSNTHSNKDYFTDYFIKCPISRIKEIPNGSLLYKENPEDCYSKKDIDLPNLNNNYLFYGYFQNEKYFKEYYDEIIDFLKNDKISNRLNNDYPNLENSFFIHFRRGDFTNNNFHEVNNDLYFTKSIEYIYTHLEKYETTNFYILSDNIEYCKNYSLFKKLPNLNFIESLDEIETIYFMNECKKGGICSNSTFSWWGSYMNTNKDKLVIQPKKWLNCDWDQSGICYTNTVIIES